jgi:drug/metabolite transporter (DMT)-like permease
MTTHSALPHGRIQSTEVTALAALVAGAFAMGISPIFVRYADVGPFTSAFYRVALALPVLWLWARLEARHAPADASGTARPARGWTPPIIAAGLFFAGDLFFWHLAILKTSIANATLLATLAPVWVALFSGLLIKEPVTRLMLLGLTACICGAMMLVGSSLGGPAGQLVGDVYGLVTSVFFGFYFLAVRVARRDAGSGHILFRSTLVTALALLIIALALERNVLPHTWGGLAALLALAFVAHVSGQGLLAYALGALSAAFSSLVIFLEALFAALAGWIVFHESLSLLQLSGGAAILAGVWIARPR